MMRAAIAIVRVFMNPPKFGGYLSVAWKAPEPSA